MGLRVASSKSQTWMGGVAQSFLWKFLMMLLGTGIVRRYAVSAYSIVPLAFKSSRTRTIPNETRMWMSETSKSISDTNAAVGERSEEEKAAIKAAREARKAEKERLKAEKKANKAAQAAESIEAKIAPVTYLDVQHSSSYESMGDFTTVMSRSESGRVFTDIWDLEGVNGEAWVRGRLSSIRVKGGSCFLVIRQDSTHTIQAVFFKDSERPEESKKMLTYLKTLTVESIVDVHGVLSSADVKSCSIQTVELSIDAIYTVARADPNMPFSVEDASRSEVDVEESQSTDRPHPRLGQELRLDHRWIDLRAPAHNSIIRIQSAVCRLYREYLTDNGFVEIHTPKLIAGESESGAGVFTTDYFGQVACLAQSPQLYKQMAISSDLTRVFEIGPVFRAENSNTRRHLCEFTGLDLEMAITDHYIETLHILHGMFKHIFNGLEEQHSRELMVIRQQYQSEPVQISDNLCLLHWPEAMEILQSKGFDIGDGLNDLTGAMELTLGEVVKDMHGTDFFVLDKYPSSVRPFYTMPDPVDSTFSNSYDLFLRGQEICSGAQRCHDVPLLIENLNKKGIEYESSPTLFSYIESFKHGVYPHAGAGIGLERVVFLYLGLDNVRKASMFPRDPNRCAP